MSIALPAANCSKRLTAMDARYDTCTVRRAEASLLAFGLRYRSRPESVQFQASQEQVCRSTEAQDAPIVGLRRPFACRGRSVPGDKVGMLVAHR